MSSAEGQDSPECVTINGCCRVSRDARACLATSLLPDNFSSGNSGSFILSFHDYQHEQPAESDLKLVECTTKSATAACLEGLSAMRGFSRFDCCAVLP